MFQWLFPGNLSEQVSANLLPRPTIIKGWGSPRSTSLMISQPCEVADQRLGPVRHPTLAGALSRYRSWRQGWNARRSRLECILGDVDLMGDDLGPPLRPWLEFALEGVGLRSGCTLSADSPTPVRLMRLRKLASFCSKGFAPSTVRNHGFVATYRFENVFYISLVVADLWLTSVREEVRAGASLPGRRRPLVQRLWCGVEAWSDMKCTPGRSSGSRAASQFRRRRREIISLTPYPAANPMAKTPNSRSRPMGGDQHLLNAAS